MKKILIYVMASAGGWYPKLLDACERTWAKPIPEGMDIMFYSNMESPAWSSLVRVDAPGGLYDMGRKNLLAYKWALENKQWDFMARTNLSCYVSKELLRKHAEKQPTENLIQGCTAIAPTGDVYLWGGGQYLVSRDVIQNVVNNGHLWDHGQMEDVAFSKLARTLGYTLDNDCASCSVNQRPNDWITIAYINRSQTGFAFTDFAQFKEENHCHFIRVKQDGDRAKDIHIMEELHKQNV